MNLPIDDVLYPAVNTGKFAARILAMDMFNSTGKRVTALRTARGISQKQMVAELREEGMDIGQSFISQIEKDVKRPSVEMLTAMVRVLRTTADYLLLLSDEPSPPTPANEAREVGVTEEAETAAAIFDSIRDVRQRRHMLEVVRLLANQAQHDANERADRGQKENIPAGSSGDDSVVGKDFADSLVVSDEVVPKVSKRGIRR